MELLECVRADKPVLLATDTVYGVAALPGGEGYKDIFALKGRNPEQVLPWLVGDVDDLNVYGADIEPYAQKLAAMFWPGALTLVVKASDRACALGGIAPDGTIALRMPDDATCLALLRQLKTPLACTSANLHGEMAPSTLDKVSEPFAQLDHDPDISGSCPVSISSTIVDCTGKLPKVLREGSIKQHVIQAVALLDDKIA